jgi:hypothetical protein
MTGRLKVILPTVNVAMAAILLGIGYIPPVGNWSPVSWQVVFSINAPANLLRNLVWFEWDKHVHPHCSVVSADTCIGIERVTEVAAFLLGVAFIWYVVGVEIEATRQGTRAMAHFGTLARVSADVVLFCAGAFFVFLFVANWRIMHLFLRSWVDLRIFCYLAWALALAIPYGRDLIRCIARRR